MLVVSVVSLDVFDRLLARSRARIASSGMRHLAVDAGAPAISAGALALAANAGFLIGH